MNRDSVVVRVVLAVLVLALGAWLYTATEWVDAYVDAKPEGEAATNELYATQALVRALGAVVVKRDGLKEMPPQRATAVITSMRWTAIAEQDERLQEWVEQGGHLLIPAYLLENDEFGDWLPIERTRGSKEPAVPWSDGTLVKGSACRDVLEMAAPFAQAEQTAETGRKWRLCSLMSYALHSSEPPLWALQGPDGTEALRVAAGQGTVTVLGPSDIALRRNVLSSDNAPALFASMGLRPQAEVWFVADEIRPSFLHWLWTHAWQAVALSTLALTAALWRAAARFGPRVADAGVGRRSVAEQVRGTAQFLRKSGGDALHQAQARALEEMAARYIPLYRTMDAAARAHAICQRTSLDSTALARAMSPTLRRTPADLQAALQLLEAARRAVQAAGMQAPASSEAV